MFFQKAVWFPLILAFLAGFSTVLGSLIFLSPSFSQRRNLGFFLGFSAGVMIYLSFMELLPEAIEDLGFFWTNIFFFAGILVMALIDFLIPHHYLEKKVCFKREVINKQLLSTGLLVTIGLTIHNFPEGIAVFLSSFSKINLGVLLAFAIAIHNIPEGIAVTASMYHATKNKTQAIKYAFIAGMAEPLGAIISYLLLKSYLNQTKLALVFAIVAGIMIYISFDELLPVCFQDNQGHRVIWGIILGMIIVSLSMFVF